MTTAILSGGPQDGKLLEVQAGRLNVAVARYTPARPHPPKPSRWHPFKRRRWQPPPPPQLPEMLVVTYKDSGKTDSSGRHIYTLDSDWKPYCGPDLAIDADLIPGLAAALYAVDPFIRHHPQTRWVMNNAWYMKIRAELGADSGDDPESWVPEPGDCVLGTRITVRADGDRPHIENPAFAASKEPA